jgi:hypothetical protein
MSIVLLVRFKLERIIKEEKAHTEKSNFANRGSEGFRGKAMGGK